MPEPGRRAMPEPTRTTSEPAAPGAGGSPAAGTARDQAPETASRRPEHASCLFYALGLGVQTFLWFLLFLALAIAVAVGGELTEFRYVGF